MASHGWKAVVLTGIILTTSARRPTCRIEGPLEKEVVCTPGHHDFALTRGLVSDNNRTTGISLKGCRISSVDYEAFEELWALQYLDLSINKIQRLRLGVLDGTPLVTSLNISYNLLTELPLGLFDQKPNLEVLVLNNNKLHSLRLGIFDPLTKLKHLDLSYNPILASKISPYLFDQNTKIAFMDFSMINMSNAPGNLLNALEEIETLNLDKCSLTEIPEFVTAANLKKLKRLVMTDNQIRRLDDPDTFVNLDNLEYLFLGANEIESIHRDVFKPLNKIKWISFFTPDIKNKSASRNLDLPLGLFDQKPEMELLDLKGTGISSLKQGILDPLLKLIHLDLSSNNILGKDINPAIFDRTTKIYMMDFSRNDMRDTRDDLLRSFRGIGFLNLDRCSLTQVPKFATAPNLSTLNFFILSFNQIKSLNESDTFGNLDPTILDLSENEIETVHKDVFKPLRQLKTLIFNMNKLVDLPLDIFAQQRNLESLDLKGNKIKTLQRGIFDTLLKLTTLDLSNNTIIGKNLDPSIFEHNTRIQMLNFSNNDMSDSPDNLLHTLQAIDVLNLDDCLLNEVPKFATAPNLATMKQLTLSANQIRRLDNTDTFSNLENLEILNLGTNEIDSIGENTFKTLKKLKTIVLRNNKLKELPTTLFQDMAKLANVDLSHNIIELVRVDTFKGALINNINLSHNKFSYLNENFCSELRNFGANLDKFFFNKNPWQCACLRELLDEAKTLGVEYNGVKYNGKQPVCVNTKDAVCKRNRDSNQLYVEMYNNITKNY